MLRCDGACAPGNPATDTVRVTIPSPAGEQPEGGPLHTEGEGEASPPEDQQARREQEEAQQLRLEEQALWEAEEEARRAQEEAEERRRREEEEAAERDRREREEAARAEAEAARAEAERLARKQEREERREAVGAFLKEHGYSGVAAPRRTMLKTKYPIHSAAKAGDAKMVVALLEEGANLAQKNSAGQTALEVARQKDKKGSHANVLRVLGGA